MRASVAIAMVGACALTGCDSPPTNTYEQRRTEIAEQERREFPVGRYQFIGKETYPDGTVEYACLDTARGTIGYAAIYPDKARENLTNFDCSN